VWSIVGERELVYTRRGFSQQEERLKIMGEKEMHAIEPAQLKPGIKQDDIPEVVAANGGDDSPSVIRGEALIFWDKENTGKKMDAIDTDQITPAQDCVSESLEELDKNWKEGAFRHLMPDFRRQVHAGKTFVIAGDRFAIGSSREMSPAGLKAVAEEAGLQLVIVCGENMGDIFRRNSLNLGLHVVQAPDAVADAEEEDEFSFDPATRTLRNETQEKTYDPTPLTPKEDDIRRSGGIFAVGRREFHDAVVNPPRIDWPGPYEATRMTTTEQILWAHRVDKDAEVAPGKTIRVYADLLPASDGTAPFAIHTFNQITGGDAVYPRQAAIVNDHFVFTGRLPDEKQTSIGKAFAHANEMEKPYYATPGDGIFHFYFPEQGLIMPGQFVPGADSHSRAYGAYGAVGVGVGSTTLGFGWANGYVYFTPAPARKVRLIGKLQPWVSGKDIVLWILKRWGARQAQGMSIEFVDVNRQLPMAYRHTICNMMAEAEAQNGIFAPDEITYDWFRGKGMDELPYPEVVPGRDAVYEDLEVFELSEIVPMISKPYSPGNAVSAKDIEKEKLVFDKAFIGSCTNGSYEDLLQAALVVKAARDAGHLHTRSEFIVYPGSGGVKSAIEQPEPRLGDRSVADVLREVGAKIRESWCGPCFGQGPDALSWGQRAITTFNRNWQNRMGLGGQGYLASPAVVAASALLGHMAAPDKLGIDWDADIFGI
jgi:3-isopropylmalate/(R)-2-methylmalate dehydratase large subunit